MEDNNLLLLHIHICGAKGPPHGRDQKHPGFCGQSLRRRQHQFSRLDALLADPDKLVAGQGFVAPD